MREDKADVVAYLKRTLSHRTDQIAELQARLEGLQQVHKTDGENYEKRLSNLEQEFSRTKEELASENMVLTKKLDALEEFRIQREQLMAKYDEQEASKDAQKQEYGKIWGNSGRCSPFFLMKGGKTGHILTLSGLVVFERL